MATSGTIGQTTYNVGTVTDQAWRRCGIPTSKITSEMAVTARQVLFLMLSSWGNLGINLWRLKPYVFPFVVGQAAYALPIGTIEVESINRVDSQGNELPMARQSRDDYTALLRKASPGNPLQYRVDRQRIPTVTFWPVPNDSTYSASCILHTHIEDPGSPSFEVDVPQRWLEATVSGLAFRVGLEVPDMDPQRLAMLKALADETFQHASDEERDMSPIFMAPDISVYTR